MRRPTPLMALLSWHRKAMAGEAPPVHDGVPECGWYKMRRKRGHWLPVEIYVDREFDGNGDLACDEQIKASVFFDPACPREIWTYLTPISRREFQRLTDYLLSNQETINPAARIDVGAAPTLPRG